MMHDHDRSSGKFSGSNHRSSADALNPIQGGGGTMCPPCHVFAYTQVGMRTRVLIFCYFSSFLVWKRLQDFRSNKMSQFSQEK